MSKLAAALTCKSLGRHAFSLFWQILKSDVVGTSDRFMCNFIPNCRTAFQSECATLHPTWPRMRVPGALHSC